MILLKLSIQRKVKSRRTKGKLDMRLYDQRADVLSASDSSVQGARNLSVLVIEESDRITRIRTWKRMNLLAELEASSVLVSPRLRLLV